MCFHVCPVNAVQMHSRMCGYWYKSNTRFGPMVHASLGIGEENSGKLVTTVRKVSQTLAKEKDYELVLVDGSPGIGCPVIASLTNADIALLIAEPTVSAIHDLHRVWELTHYLDINLQLVEEIRSFCEQNDIPIVGELDYDQSFTKAQIQGQSILEYDPKGLGGKFKEIWKNFERYL